jgi:hypothetical protein
MCASINVQEQEHGPKTWDWQEATRIEKPAPLITVTTPTIRLHGAQMVLNTLQSQTFKRWDWLISTKEDLVDEFYYEFGDQAEVFAEPYNPIHKVQIYKSNNYLASIARGELIVTIVDWTYLSPDALQKLWDYYKLNPLTMIGLTGKFYKEVKIPSVAGEFPSFIGEPAWTNECHPYDAEFGIYHEIDPSKFDFAVASCSKKAYFVVGGLDEEFDTNGGFAEKEFAARLKKIGFKIYTDHSIEMKGYDHGQPAWYKPEHFARAQEYYRNCLYQIEKGTRVVLPYMLKY